MTTVYLWLKALHIIAVVAWFAGMFYLPRLFVYHIEATSDEVKKTLEVMETKLLRVIMNPAMIATYVLGTSLLVSNSAFLKNGWMHAKLLLVLILGGYHGFLSATRKKLAAGTCKYTSKQMRLINEIPTLLLVAVVILVVVKPF
jgi:putative membrane protein